MAERTRIIYPKRLRNREIEESIALAMAQFREERPDLVAKQQKLLALEVPKPLTQAA